MRNVITTTAVAAAAALSIAGPANATVILTLSDINTAGFGPAPYGTVSVTLTTPTTANIVFNAVTPYTFGEMGLNVNSTSFSSGAVSFTKAASSNQTPTYTPTFNGQLDGFGNFRLDDVANPAGFSASVIQASFTLTDLSGTWSSDANVLTPNNPQGKEAAIHVFNGATGGNSAFAADGQGTVTPAPEPASLALLGVGLLGTAAFAQRKRRAT